MGFAALLIFVKQFKPSSCVVFWDSIHDSLTTCAAHLATSFPGHTPPKFITFLDSDVFPLLQSLRIDRLVMCNMRYNVQNLLPELKRSHVRETSSLPNLDFFYRRCRGADIVTLNHFKQKDRLDLKWRNDATIISVASSPSSIVEAPKWLTRSVVVPKKTPSQI